MRTRLAEGPSHRSARGRTEMEQNCCSRCTKDMATTTTTTTASLRSDKEECAIRMVRDTAELGWFSGFIHQRVCFWAPPTYWAASERKTERERDGETSVGSYCVYMIAPSLPPTLTHKTLHNARLCMESVQRDDLAEKTTCVLFSETFPEDQTWRRCQSQTLRKLSPGSPQPAHQYKGCIYVQAISQLRWHWFSLSLPYHWVLQGFLFFSSHMSIPDMTLENITAPGWEKPYFFFL